MRNNTRLYITAVILIMFLTAMFYSVVFLGFKKASVNDGYLTTEIKSVAYDVQDSSADAIEPVTLPETECPPSQDSRANTEGVLFRCTAYCSCRDCCGKSDGITISGTIAKEGRTVGVDTSVIPLGTTIIIEGTEYIAEDTGGAIKGNQIDIYFDSHEEALAFGVRYLKVEVIENGGN